MKKGLIVYNRKDAEWNTWYYNRMIELGREYDLDITLVYTEDIYEYDVTDCDFALMRNRDYKCSKFLEEKGLRLFNPSEVTRICNDKWETYNYFKNLDIPMMYTQRSKMPYPFVLKPRDGHGGAFVYLIENEEQYKKALEEIKKDYLSSKVQNDIDEGELAKVVNEYFIYQLKATDTGKDLRVYVLGDMILVPMLRESDSDFRANFSQGGHAKETGIGDEELKILKKVTHAMQSDLIGIDFIYNNGTPVLNEIEDVVGTRMVYKYTDIDACQEYIKWIAKSLQE